VVDEGVGVEGEGHGVAVWLLQVVVGVAVKRSTQAERIPVTCASQCALITFIIILLQTSFISSKVEMNIELDLMTFQR